MASSQNRLSCYKSTCPGTLQTDGPELFHCSDCNAEMSEDATRRVAGMDGPVAQLANVLLEKSGLKREDEIDRRSIYVAKSDSGELKVGVSNDPERRIRELSTANPNAIELLVDSEVDKAGKAERELHEQLQEYRTSGEWFDVPESVEEAVLLKVEEL
jgi:hypothetical protein